MTFAVFFFFISRSFFRRRRRHRRRYRFGGTNIEVSTHANKIKLLTLVFNSQFSELVATRAYDFGVSVCCKTHIWGALIRN